MQRDGGPGGAGGAGNPVGGSFTGPAETLEIVGDHAYCVSGDQPASQTPATVMNFRTGNFYLVGEFQVNMAIRDALTQTAVSFAVIDFNGITVARLAAGFTGTDSHPSTTTLLVIPAYTDVAVSLYSDANESLRFATLSLTGRIYRG